MEKITKYRALWFLNWKGQLGTGDVKFKMSFAPLEKIFAQKVIDIAAGFQHAVYLAGI